MSISGLSNHLCIVVATIISVLVGSSIFQRICAATELNDFTESRQFKRNLAVSKYRNNTYWLPNYTWKPPEKFDGPRKRPAWEVEKVTESPADKKEREEHEEWEKKMREVTRHEREKWDNDKTKDETSESVIEGLKDITENSEFNNSFERAKNQSDASLIVNNNLHNSRWGMSDQNPIADEFFNDSPKTLNPIMTNRMHQETMKEATFSNGRWGIDVKKPPKEFSKEMSRISPNRVRNQDEADEDRTPLGNRKIYDGAKEREETKNVATGRASTKLTSEFPNGRWGMTGDSPPREFLREIARHAPTRIPGFYKSRTFYQPDGTIGKNNYPSDEFMFLRIPKISVLEILQSFPEVDDSKMRISIFPGCTSNPRKLRISSKYNLPTIRCIICHS